ncbi:MAG TPA: hypothetical protein VF498_10285 [Anaerolineales bacterium]
MVKPFLAGLFMHTVPQFFEDGLHSAASQTTLGRLQGSLHRLKLVESRFAGYIGFYLMDYRTEMALC